MSTTTEATEGQVKIRELLEQALDQAPQCTCSEAYTSRGMAAPDCAGCGDEDEAQDWFDIKDVGVELRTRLSALLTK